MVSINRDTKNIAQLAGQVSHFNLAIVRAEFNSDITLRLEKGARECFHSLGLSSSRIDCFTVPGAFELPLVCLNLAQTHNYDGILALGAVIRGETAHFEFVADQSARGIMDASLLSGIPISFGVLTTENIEQALDRCGGKYGHKGYDTALGLVETISVLKNIN